MKAELSRTDNGFRFGPVVVEAVAAVQMKKNRGESLVIQVNSDGGGVLTLYISPKGKKVRVYRNQRELR